MSNRSFRDQTKGTSFIPTLGANADGFRLPTNPLPSVCSVTATFLLHCGPMKPGVTALPPLGMPAGAYLC